MFIKLFAIYILFNTKLCPPEEKTQITNHDVGLLFFIPVLIMEVFARSPDVRISGSQLDGCPGIGYVYILIIKLQYPVSHQPHPELGVILSQLLICDGKHFIVHSHFLFILPHVGRLKKGGLCSLCL